VTFGLKQGSSGDLNYILSESQRDKLQTLAMRADVSYTKDIVEHVDALAALWTLAFPTDERPENLKSEKWKEMGWQGSSPETDFRAGGLLSLENLLWLGNRRPALFEELRRKSRGARSEFEYPFAAAGVNLTFNLVEILEIRKQSPVTPSGVCFAKLLDNEEEAFEAIYALTFDALDREWLDTPNANYMDFPSVLKRTKQKLTLAMDGAISIDEIARRLGIASVS
jgi:hypothetical protein